MYDILINIKNEVKMICNCPIINVMFIQNDTLWVYMMNILSSFFPFCHVERSETSLFRLKTNI